MNLVIRPVPLMRTLLSRGGLVGVMLLAVLVLGHSASPQHALLVQSASITLAIPETGPELEPTPRQLARLLATPSPQSQAIPAPAVRGTVRPRPARVPAPPRVAVGTGQWGLINQDRQAAGLAPLQWSPCLANVPTGQPARMATQGYISHAHGRILALGCHLGLQASESIGFQGGGIHDAALDARLLGDAARRGHILG